MKGEPSRNARKESLNRNAEQESLKRRATNESLTGRLEEESLRGEPERWDETELRRRCIHRWRVRDRQRQTKAEKDVYTLVDGVRGRGTEI